MKGNAWRVVDSYGYSDELASGTIAPGGTIGILIPPPIIMVIYGILTQTNFGHLFAAGMILGLLLLVFFPAISLWLGSTGS